MTHPVLTALGLTGRESGTYLGSGDGRTTTRRRRAGAGQPDHRRSARRGCTPPQADYETHRRARARPPSRSGAPTPAPRRGEADPPVRRRAAHAQGRAGLAGRAGDGQVQARRRRRSAGDDRHRRLRRRPVAPALRPDHALRAPGPPHVRAVASARHRRRDHQRVQLPGRGVGLELRSSPRSAATSRSGSRRRRRRCRRSPR